NLTPAGTEPHELELTARDTAALEDASLVVYLGGFAAAVDDGIHEVASDHAPDVASAAGLPEPSGRRAPHFWLDPTRLASVAAPVAIPTARTSPAPMRAPSTPTSPRWTASSLPDWRTAPTRRS